MTVEWKFGAVKILKFLFGFGCVEVKQIGSISFTRCFFLNFLGTLLTVPCSRVGHIFRKRSPYKWMPGVNVLKKNSVRLAEVWLDDYKVLIDFITDTFLDDIKLI